MLLAFFLIKNDVRAGPGLALEHIASTASASRVQRDHRTTRARTRAGNVAYTATPRVVLCAPVSQSQCP